MNLLEFIEVNYDIKLAQWQIGYLEAVQLAHENGKQFVCPPLPRARGREVSYDYNGR